MHLHDYIRAQHDDLTRAFTITARKFSVTPRTVRAWYYFERHPSVEVSRFIVSRTKGEVDYGDIYRPYTEKK